MIYNSRFFFSLDLFSSGLFFLGSYFLRLYWQPPYYFRKKVLGIQNTGLYFHWQFFQGLDKIRTFFQSFYFQLFFFQKLFFPGISYIDSNQVPMVKFLRQRLNTKRWGTRLFTDLEQSKIMHNKIIQRFW